jgi:hypothetical protein
MLFITVNIFLTFCVDQISFEKRHSNMSVHCSPCFQNVGEGDVVTVGQCRPLAKTVKFNVLEHQPSLNKVPFAATPLSQVPIAYSSLIYFMT